MIISSIQGNEAAALTAKVASIASVPTNAQLASDAAAAGKNFYFSPALVIDPKSGTDVLEYRNSSTGVVTGQYPSEKDLKAYSQHSLKQDDAKSETDTATDTTKAAVATQPAAKPVVVDDDASSAKPDTTATPTESIVV